MLTGLLGLLGLLASGPLGLVGCDRADPDADPARTRIPTAGTPDGIVSLSPAMTTIIRDLGAEQRLVGRTPWCRGIDDRPVVGALDGVDAERLSRLRPSVVVIQPAATGPDPVVLSLRDRLGFALIARRLDGVADVLAAIDDLQSTGVGEAAIASERRNALQAVAAAAAAPRSPEAPRVLVLHSVDPFSAAGGRTYLDEVVRAAGGVNAIERPGWITLGAEEVIGASPQVVMLVTGGLVDRTVLDRLPWETPPTVIEVASSDAIEPSTRMPEVVEVIAARLVGGAP